MNFYIKQKDIPLKCSHCELFDCSFRSVRGKHPHCPLIIISEYKFETCETCDQTKNCFIYCHLRKKLDNIPKMVCENWIQKDNNVRI